MCDSHTKKTFREFKYADIGEDFRCKECGWTVEIRDWMKRTLTISSAVLSSILMVVLDEASRAFGIDRPWALIYEIPIAFAAVYVYLRALGYLMYRISWRIDEKYRGWNAPV